MPSCGTDLLNKKWPSSETVSPGSNGSSGYQSPSSPTLLSPMSTSPNGSLTRRRGVRRASSLGSVIQEPFVIQSDCRDSRSQSPVPPPEPDEEEPNVLTQLIGWYPCLLLRLLKITVFASFRQLLVAVPAFWLRAWLWCFWQLVTWPLSVAKFLLTPSADRYRKKKTVLINAGSTIQALHLARNFYSAGAKVIVCEVDGLFALTRFSTAASKFYTVPKPTGENQQNYVRALCEIVDKENVTYYVPASATTSAYYDSVAKPHLELLGCTCFCPGIKEVWALDDTLELLKRCEKAGLATPNYYPITSTQSLMELYDSGAISGANKCVMSAAGPSGVREPAKILLPLLKSDLKLPRNCEISEHRPWVVVQDNEDDEHFVTCTTVKDSRIIANVTCKIDTDNKGLVPVENVDVTAWLNAFLSKMSPTLLRPINGHISVKFALSGKKTLLPLTIKVGISLPYICYTSVHPRLLWRPCKHFSRQNSGPIVAENGRYWMPETVLSALRKPSVESVTKFIGTVLDKREALFALWDPLPYCAYYHMQLPLRNLVDFVQRTHDCLPQVR